MTPEQALDVVAAACAAVQGNLQTHQQIQQALKVLHDEIVGVDIGALQSVPEADEG